MTWDKLYVLTGEEFIIRTQLIPSLAEKHKSNINLLDLTINNISILKNYSLSNRIYMLDNPTTSVLKDINSIMEENALANYLIVKIDNIDMRSVFFTKAKSKKRIFNIPYIGEANISNYLDKYASDFNIKISKDAKEYILSAAPVVSVKIDNKDTNVFDIENIDNTLNTIVSYCRVNNVILDKKLLLKYCIGWDTQGEIWDFIRYIIYGDKIEAIKIISKIIKSEGIHGALYTLINQLELNINIISILKNKSNITVEEICDILSLKQHLNKYNEADKHVTPVEPRAWYIKKVLTNIKDFGHKIDIDILSSKYNCAVNALIDLKSGADSHSVLAALILGLIGKFEYTTPIFVNDTAYFGLTY